MCKNKTLSTLLEIKFLSANSVETYRYNLTWKDKPPYKHVKAEWVKKVYLNPSASSINRLLKIVK